MNRHVKPSSSKKPPYHGGHRRTSLREVLESNGPCGKIRGTVQQIIDRYMVLGRDVLSSSDDIVAAEACFQHAEHYRRVLLASREEGSTSSSSEARSESSPQSNAPMRENRHSNSRKREGAPVGLSGDVQSETLAQQEDRPSKSSSSAKVLPPAGDIPVVAEKTAPSETAS
eukprot:g8571.t1